MARGGGGAASGRGADGRGGAGDGSGGRRDSGGGKGSDREDRDLARQLDKSRNLPGANIGGRANQPKGVPDGGGVHYNPKYDTYVQRTPIAQKNLMDAVKSYNDRSFLERALGFVGVGQVDPTTDPNFNAAKHNQPQSSFDALGMGLGAVGLATGLPVGTMYDLGKGVYSQATGTNPTFGEVNIGDFGQAPQTGYGNLPGVGQTDSQTDPNEGPFGGFSGGGGTGAGQSNQSSGMSQGSPSYSGGKQMGEGKDPAMLAIASALSSGTPPNPQPAGAVNPSVVPAIQLPQMSNWQGAPAINAPANGPPRPVTNYPGMRWIGGGMASRPLYG